MDIHMSLVDKTNLPAIRRLREKFLAENTAVSAAENNSDQQQQHQQLYHPIDVQRVSTENWQIERFLLSAAATGAAAAGSDSETLAYDQLKRSLQWKQSIGLHDWFGGDYFPRELYEIFGHEPYGRCQRTGRLVVWTTENRYRRLTDHRLSQLVRQFLAYRLEQQDRSAGNHGWISVNDCSGAGLGQVDIGLARYRIDILSANYPLGVHQSLNVDMPWLLRSSYRLVKQFMPSAISDQLELVGRQELTDYFPADEIPACFGGTTTKKKCTLMDDNSFMDDLKPLSQCSKHLGLTDGQVDNFYDTYQGLFNKL